EIEVSDGDTDIPDNTGTVDFGTATVGTAVTRTFTIANSGTTELSVSDITLPDGFNLVGDFPNAIAPSSTA
ncbi:hypothetical protein, partial [Lyngbya sp. CCY1209]|uniref:hypothetical protein n=1 Tax=Lyngbya sp. CCY1209 TaxID=2886103 RepID=UPI002D1FE502